MGKTPEKLRLVIGVDAAWVDDPKIVALREQGHTILPLVLGAHLILSKNAHMWDDSMWPLLDVTMKAARKRKKEGTNEQSDQG